MKRCYSDEERANALATLKANGGKVSLTARQLGIPEVTLRQWASGLRHPEAMQMSESKSALLADHLEEVAFKLVKAMPKKIEKAGLQQVAVSLGISVEKVKLLRGEPTEIIKGELDLGQLTDDQIEQLEAILAAASGGRAPRTLPPQS